MLNDYPTSTIAAGGLLRRRQTTCSVGEIVVIQAKLPDISTAFSQISSVFELQGVNSSRLRVRFSVTPTVPASNVVQLSFDSTGFPPGLYYFDVRAASVSGSVNISDVFEFLLKVGVTDDLRPSLPASFRPSSVENLNAAFLALAGQFQSLAGIATIKAASTLPVAADTAIVVSNRDAIITTCTSSTASVTSTSSTALASNPVRKYAAITNTGLSDVYLHCGATAISGQGILLKTNGSFEIDSTNLYDGIVAAVTTSGTSSLAIMEGV